MTYKEALYQFTKYLDKTLWIKFPNVDPYKFYNHIVQAVEKQIPKKIKYVSDDVYSYQYYCPSCGGLVGLGKLKHLKYCYRCGQRLDWGDK